ncbi:hypothetical protein OHA21_09530 [Actinoplanes sp. NBC_00393]|uniref:hypothetical protein n=1 Tax=Actinoplanes sp. NBC_00393 TaxID=2975953 RepID=UPI002E1CEB7E
MAPRLVEHGAASLRRFRATDLPADLRAAVAALERAAALTPAGDPDRSAILSNLGLALIDVDPARAVTVLDEAVETSVEPAQRSAALANLGIALLAGPAHQAVDVLIEAAALAAGDPDEQSRRFGNLGIAFGARYQHSGDAKDLDRAVDAYEQAVANAREDRPTALANLSTGLAERYAVHGRPHDLDRAIDLSAQALQSAPDADRIENQALMLRDRFVRDGDLADLDEAVDQLETIPGLLDQLATTLRMRASYRGDPAELRRAVELHREAAKTVEQAARIPVLNNLGGSLRAWAAATELITPLDEAISAYREALSLAEAKDDRSAIRGNLGIGLLDRYDRTSADADLDAAIDELTAAVAETDPRSPDLPARLANLGNGLRRRFDRHRRPDDADQTAAAYRRAGRLTGSAEAALRAELNWGRWANQHRDWTQAREAFAAARTAADRLLAQQVMRRDKESSGRSWPPATVRRPPGCGRWRPAGPGRPPPPSGAPSASGPPQCPSNYDLLDCRGRLIRG